MAAAGVSTEDPCSSAHHHRRGQVRCHGLRRCARPVFFVTLAGGRAAGANAPLDQANGYTDPMITSLGETWLENPIRGYWNIVDAWGRLHYPDDITVNGRPYRKAGWREEKAGVIEQYREAVKVNSHHLHVLADGTWLIDHTDDVNPDMGDATAPARHFFADHPVGKGLLLAGAVVGACALFTTIAGAFGSGRRA